MAGVAGIALAQLMPACAYGHGPEMLLGSTKANGGALALSYEFSDEDVLTPSVSLGGLTLYTSVFPGFEWLQDDAPDLGLFALKSGTPFSMKVVSISPGVSIKFGSVTLKAAGDSTLVGTTTRIPDDHVHPEWHLLLADGVTGVYSVSFKVTTTIRGFSDSPVYTLVLTNIPQDTTPTEAPTPTATLTAVPTPTPSVTPSPTNTPLPTATHAQSPTPIAVGDANCDGDVTAADLVLSVLFANARSPSICGADVNADGEVTAADLGALFDLLFAP